jgi:hypothetical protein
MLFSNLKIEKGQVIAKDHDVAGSIVYQGLPITIENEEGSIRKWKNQEGEKGKTEMFYRYGYIDGTIGVDGEEIDCFIGLNPYASNVYVIRLGKDDREEKVMLGFDSREAARDAFLAHYQDQSFLGEITEMPMYLFKDTLEFK